MTYKKSKWITLAVAFSLAILQALQPFIHGHLDIDHAIEHSGFHLGDEYEDAVIEHVNSEHTLTTTPHSIHTISVASGIKQDVEPILTADMIGLILVAIFLAISLHPVRLKHLQFSNLSYQLLKRRLPPPRAPPQY